MELPNCCPFDIYVLDQDVLQVAKELKSRTSAYNSIKTSLQTLERNLQWVTTLKKERNKSHELEININICITSGTLQNRSLKDIVRKEDLVVSEYLTTLLVFVTRSVTCLLPLVLHRIRFLFMLKTFFWNICRRSYFHWESTYECLSDLVVPRSSR